MTNEEAIRYFKRHIDLYCVTGICREAEETAIKALEQQPSDTVSRGAFEQVMWERDVAIGQLKELGYGLGQKVEPCDDAISREAVLDLLATRVPNPYYENVFRAVGELTPVTQKSGKWISVSERLPEDAQEVLYSTKTGRVFHGEYYDDNTDRKWFSYKDDMFSFNNVVTAWMPLPKPYESQERSDKE